MPDSSLSTLRKPAIRDLWKPALIALFFVSSALLASFPLRDLIAYPFVFLFYGAIMGSAWMGGVPAGLFSVALSALSVGFFFLPPYNSIAIASEAQTFFMAFLLCAVAVSLLSSARKRAELLVRETNDRLESMVQARTAELERSYEEIREREGYLRELTEAIPQQIWRANAEGQIEHLNLHLRHYLGDSTPLDDELFFTRILHPDDAPLFRAAWTQALASGENLETEARLRGADGEARWFLIRAMPQRASDGRIAHWYGVHIDIEEQRRAQQGLAAAQDELALSARTLTMAEMAASIAHELNQPLTAVVTHAYACREWLSAAAPNLPRAAATAEKIVQESTRASNVLKRVRALFRNETLDVHPANINHLIVDLIRLLRNEAIRRNISIRRELAHAIPLVEADPVSIRQLLLNLANNAMDAMSVCGEERELLFRTQLQEDGLVAVSVQDTGCGIPDGMARQIFEPFFSTKPHGAGMGLAICRSIIEAHGGRLMVENLPGGGARFHFTLRANG